MNRVLSVLRVVALAVLCTWLAGCTRCTTPPPVADRAGPDVFLMHAPLHPGNDAAVTLTAETTGTVDRIEIAYEQYTLTTAWNGSHTQTEVQARTTVETCDPEGSVTGLTCTYTFGAGFPAGTLVKITATAHDDEGSGSESYAFAAGDYPWADDPIPIRSAGAPDSHYDVVFIRDTDISAEDFRVALEEVVGDLYFKYPIIQTWRGLYNFYYSDKSGDYEEVCSFTNPSNMGVLQSVGDSVVFLHQTTLRDCRSGARISSEIDYDKSLIHETGHVLFGLQDEYCCDSFYDPQNCHPNLWDSLGECQAAAPGLGLDPADCAQLASGAESLDYWFIDPSGQGGCMMGEAQHTADSDFGPACEDRIMFKYGKCTSSNCFSWPECP